MTDTVTSLDTKTKPLPTHLHPEFAHFAFMPNDERIHFVQSPRWIGYPKAKNIHDMMLSLLKYPEQEKMPNLLIVGEANNGKTALLKHFYRKFGEPVTVDLEVRKPIIYIQANASSSEKEFYMAILDGFNAVYNYSSSTMQLKHQVVHYVRNFHTKMVIIDEIHSLLSGSPRQQRHMMNVIKWLCNALCIPFVLAGTKSALQVLHTDPQHISRFQVMELPLWKYDKEFAKLVGSLERVLPLKEPSQLTIPEKLSVIFEMSKGCVGYTKQFVAQSAINAINNNSEHIRLQDLQNTKWTFNRHNGVLEYNHQ